LSFAGAGYASLFVSHPGFPPSSPLQFNLLGVFYAIHVAVAIVHTDSHIFCGLKIWVSSFSVT
jgi:hypothetical protein